MAVQILPFLLLLALSAGPIRAEEATVAPALQGKSPILQEIFQGQFSKEHLSRFQKTPRLQDLVRQMSPQQRQGARAILADREATLKTSAERREIARGYLLLDDAQQTLRIATGLIEDNAQDPEALNLSASASYALGDYDAAAKNARTALEINPHDQAAYSVWMLTRGRAAEAQAELPADPVGRNEVEVAERSRSSSRPELTTVVAKSVLANIPAPPAPGNENPLANDGSLKDAAHSAFAAAAAAAGGFLLLLGLGGRRLEDKFPGIRRNMALAAVIGGVVALSARALPAIAPLVLSNPPAMERARNASAAKAMLPQRQMGVKLAERISPQSGAVQTLLRVPSQVLPELPGAVTAGERVRSLLMPGGRLIGNKGSSSYVRVMSGKTLKDAEQFFGELARGGKVVPHPRGSTVGKSVKFSDGTIIFLRYRSQSGPPTIDIKISGDKYVKIKFLAP